MGRARELERLGTIAGAAVEGRGRLVLMTGDPGIGKTTLAEEVAARAAARGARTLWASCWEGAGAPPFWPWLQVARALGEEGAEIAEALGASPERSAAEVLDPEQARFRLYDRLATSLTRLSRARPLTIVLDDVHWADPASVAALRFLAEAGRGERLLMLATYRDSEVTADHPLSAVIAGLGRIGETESVLGLPRDEVGELIEMVAGEAATPPVVRAVHDRTGGNPLFVREVASLLAAQGRLTDPSASIPVPPTVRETIERRLARLSQACFEAVSTAAVIGPTFHTDVLSTVTGAGATGTLPVLEEALAANLLRRTDETTYAFAHALIRDALYEGLGAVRRAKLHRAIAEALEKRYEGTAGSHQAEIAEHYRRAATEGDAEKAYSLLVEAARYASTALAYEEAVGHYERALQTLDLIGIEAERRAELLLELGDARLRTGNVPGARAAFEQAAAIARDTGRAELLARAALGFGAGLGGFEVSLFDRGQIDLLQEALRTLPDDDAPLRAWVMARLSVAKSFVGSPEERLRLGKEAVAMARRSGADDALGFALGSYCDSIAGPTHSEARIAAADEMLSIAGRLPGTEALALELLARRHRVLALLEIGDVVGFDAEVARYEEAAAVLDQPLYTWYGPLFRGTRALLAGDADEVLRQIAEVRAIGARAHSGNASLLAATQELGLLLEMGAEREGFEMVYEVSGAAELDIGGYPGMRILIAAVELHRGNQPTARAMLRALAARGFEEIPVDAEWLNFLAWAGEAAAVLRDPEIAGSLYPLLRPFAHRFVVDGIAAAATGSCETHLGVIARTLGHLDDAIGHLERGIAANETAGCIVPAARTRFRLAETLIERDAPGDRERAEETAREALATYEQIGFVERVRRLRALLGDEPHAPPTETAFRRGGELWTLCFAGAEIRLKDSKGLRDIAELLRRPGVEVHVIDLASGGAPEARTAAGGDLGPALDDRARAAYRSRVEELHEAIGEAEALGDSERAALAREEMEALAEQLGAAYGLGGRARPQGDAVERARKAVTARIRDAIARVEREHPALGRHLAHSIRTGIFCSYDPEEPVTWAL